MTSKQNHTSFTNIFASRYIISLISILVVTLLSWILFSAFSKLNIIQFRHILEALFAFVFNSFLTIGYMECCLRNNVPERWSYRLAFGLSNFMAIIYWSVLPLGQSINLLALLGGMVGAFGGGLVGTAYHLGLWEDNLPPPETIRRSVYMKHQEIIGQPPRTPILKRIFDIVFSFVGIFLTFPLWILCAFTIWIEEPGSIFFIKNSIGKGGINFRQLKFRTMVSDAECTTGPIPAREDDTRALRIGRLLRKSALDELPQLVNILFGTMSFVGPRPQRTVLVYEYIDIMPEFAERHTVLPGLSGLAQVVGDYYNTPRQKLRYDRIYAKHVSLGFDLKLILLAIFIVFWLRWKPDWNGRIPRKWLRYGSR